ncbi:MAG TPA: signal peptide peptidase SppA [Bacteroidia bacterium]|nr:signal peptide peptidase SppA [Bacteroidia bacterium]
MKTFFASLLGTLVGIVLAFLIIFFICAAIIGSAFKSLKEEEVIKVQPSSVLEIRLNHSIGERSSPKMFHFKLDDNTFSETVGLNDIIEDIHHAAKDTLLKGIYLNLSDIPAGMAIIEAIRHELAEFKNSGKFIFAYGIGYSQKSYYLASVADKVYMHPEGIIFLKGLSAQIMFYKKALDKLGVQVQVFRHGRYKSFVEPFILDKMSPDNRVQTRSLMVSLWDKMLGDMGVSRNITFTAFNNMADSLTVRTAEAAQQHGLVDSLLYSDQVMDKIKQRLKLTTQQNISFIGLDDYRETFHTNTSSSKIAVIYAIGDIVSGNGDDESIGSSRISETIKQARLDANIKAIVLRINSPGGDAVASDVIWREVQLTKQVKPVIVSMGDVAASGGYYIACAANVIVCEPTTITGSIGVFGLLPNAQQLLNDKLGITVDTVSTNTHASAGSLYYPLLSNEMAVLQNGIENFYHTFMSRVAAGRNLTIAQVDSIAQGRVWSGIQSRKIGLTDTLGGMDLALKIAAEKAHLTEYSIEELPSPFGPFHKFLSRFSSNIETEALKNELGDIYEPVEEIKKLMKTTGVQARMPYQLIIE